MCKNNELCLLCGSSQNKDCILVPLKDLILDLPKPVPPHNLNSFINFLQSFDAFSNSNSFSQEEISRIDLADDPICLACTNLTSSFMLFCNRKISQNSNNVASLRNTKEVNRSTHENASLSDESSNEFNGEKESPTNCCWLSEEPNPYPPESVQDSSLDGHSSPSIEDLSPTETNNLHGSESLSNEIPENSRDGNLPLFTNIEETQRKEEETNPCVIVKRVTRRQLALSEKILTRCKVPFSAFSNKNTEAVPIYCDSQQEFLSWFNLQLVNNTNSNSEIPNEESSIKTCNEVTNQAQEFSENLSSSQDIAASVTEIVISAAASLSPNTSVSSNLSVVSEPEKNMITEHDNVCSVTNGNSSKKSILKRVNTEIKNICNKKVKFNRDKNIRIYFRGPSRLKSGIKEKIKNIDRNATNNIEATNDICHENSVYSFIPQKANAKNYIQKKYIKNLKNKNETDDSMKKNGEDIKIIESTTKNKLTENTSMIMQTSETAGHLLRNLLEDRKKQYNKCDINIPSTSGYNKKVFENNIHNPPKFFHPSKSSQLLISSYFNDVEEVQASKHKNVISTSLQHTPVSSKVTQKCSPQNVPSTVAFDDCDIFHLIKPITKNLFDSYVDLGVKCDQTFMHSQTSSSSLVTT